MTAICIYGCGEDQKSAAPTNNPTPSTDKSAQQKQEREQKPTPIAAKTTPIQDQINSTLKKILAPKNIFVEAKLSKMELIDSAKPLDFSNIKFLQTDISLKTSKPSSYETIQKLLDSDFENMNSTINFDSTSGITGVAETKVNVFKLVNIYSRGWLKPTEVRQLLPIVQIMDPFETNDAAAYAFDSSSNTIKAKKEIPNIAKFDGTIYGDRISVTTATKDIQTLKSHPLFQAYESIVVEYLKTLDVQKLENSVTKYIDQLTQK